MERLSGDFNRGYTKAIQHITEIIDYIQDDLKSHHKNLTGKYVNKLMRCVLLNREKLRDDWNGFIRYSQQKDDFEWFDVTTRGYRGARV